MADENKDLAILGFKVDADGATKAIRSLNTALGALDRHFQISDDKLARKILATINGLGDMASGATSAAEALKALNVITGDMPNLDTAASNIKKAVKAMKDSGLDAVAKQYAKSIGQVANAFSSVDTRIAHTILDMQSIFEKPLKDVDVKQLEKLISQLDTMKKKLDAVADPTQGIKLPDSIQRTDVKALAKEVGGLLKQASDFQAAAKEFKGSTIPKELQRDADIAKDAFAGYVKTYDQAMNKLLPSDVGSIRLRVSFVNLQDELDKIPKDVSFRVENQTMNALNAFIKSVNELQAPQVINLVKPHNVLSELQAEVQTIFSPNIRFQTNATQTAKNFYDDIQTYFNAHPLEMPVSLAITTASAPQEVEITKEVEKARVALFEKLFKKASKDNIVSAMIGDDKDTFAKYFNDAMAGNFETLNGIIATMYDKADKVIKMQEEVSKLSSKPKVEAMESIDYKKDVEAFAKILDPQLAPIRDLLTFSPQIVFTQENQAEAKQAVNRLLAVMNQADSKKVSRLSGLGAFNLTAFNQSLTEAQNAYDNFISHLMLEENKPKIITVDTSSVSAKLMNEPLHVKGANVMVHPAAIKVDTAFVSPEAVKLIGGVQETLEKTVNVDPHVQEIEKVAEIYDKAAGAAGALEEKIKSVAKLLKGDMKALFTAVIKSGIADPSRELYRISVQEEKLEEEGKRWQSVYDALTNGDASGVSQARVQDAEQSYKRRKQMEDTVGQSAKNANQQQKEYNETLDEFNKKLDITDKNVDELVRSIGMESAAMKSVAQAERQTIQNTAQAAAAMAGFGASVNRASWSIERMGRVVPTNLVDPFIRMKAEIGETGSRIADFGRSIGLYFGGRTVINYFRQAAESANTFGMEIRRIQSLATDFDFSNLKNELMDIDARFGSVVHNANALYWAFSSGVRGSERDLANFTEIMSKTATTIKSDIMPTVDAATSIMNAWNLTAGSAGEIGDLLFSIIKYGKSNASQLTTALGHVVAPAAALNLNLDELGATIATLTKTMKTNRALTYLSNILGKLASPTKKVQEAAAEFGIELSANAIKARGFARTLRDIREATGGDVGKIAKLFPDLRGQRAAITLLSTQYADFEKQLENMRVKAGAMEEALSRITDTPESQLRALRNTVSMISIGAGDAVNNVLTLGGALGPILKTVNGLEHGGRELLGHLVAAAGATAGIAIAMRAMKVAQFAAAQAAFQLAAAETDTNKVALSNALLAEKRLVDENALMVATLKREVAEKHNNDEILQNLRAQLDTYKEATKEGNKRIVQAQQALKIEDQIIKRRMQEKASGIGTSKARLASLGGWLTELQTGEGQKNLNTSLNLIKRLQADISESGAKLADEQRQLIQQYNALIQPLVEKEGQTRTAMMDAMHSGQVGAVENFKKLKDTILQAIKANTAIAGQKASYDQDERILEQQIRRAVLAEMQKGLVEGENYQHSLLIKFVEDEIKKEKAKLADMTAQLDVLKQQNATDAEVAAQVDAIAKQTAEVNALDAKKLEITTQIEQRERALTGRKSEQVKMLEASVNESQRILAIDTEDVEKLNEKLELQLKNAAVAGKATLEATKASVVAQRDYYASLLQLKTLRREEKTLIDDSGKLINESAEAEARLAEIQREREKTLKRMLALQEKFVALGVKAGNQEAIVLRQSNWGGSRGELVDRLARDKGVINDAVRTMSSEIGKNLFGGMLGGKGAMGMSMLTPFIPGLGKWGMGVSMLASFNVFGKAASGMSRLTAGAMRLLGTTEKLQKQGVLKLDKGVEDLTRSLLTSRLTLKGFKLTVDSFKSLAVAGNSKALAGSLAGTMGWIGGAGAIAIIGGAILAGLAMYFKSEKGGPLGDLAESMLGIDDLERFSSLLDMRRERMQQERETNESMVREVRRMLALQEEQNAAAKQSVIWQRETNKLNETLANLSVFGQVQQNEMARFNKQNRRSQLKKQREGALMAMESSPFAYLSLQDIDKEMAANKGEIDALVAESNELYKKLWAGIGEYRYQEIREAMDADRDAAFTPMLDANGKMELATKMVSMSSKRIASLLGYDDKILDLSAKSTLEVREMIRAHISKLGATAAEAQKAWQDAKDDAEQYKPGSPERTKADQHVQELEQAFESASKKVAEDSSNLRSAFQDFYNKIAGQANAMVEQLKETSKLRQRNAKFQSMFMQTDETFNVLGDTIVDYWGAMNKLKTDYANRAGIFKNMTADDAATAFKAALKQLGDEQMQNITNNVSSIKSMQENLARFMETQANDVRAMSKQQFDFRMSNPAFARMRPQLMRARMAELNGLMAALIPQRNEAFQRAQELMGQPGQMVRAQAALEEAYKIEKQAKGVEQEQLELVKKRAEIEKGINTSLYQLAAQIQGKFESTVQTAVDASSAESIRLQMRRIGENIAPAINTSAQELESKMMERLYQQNLQNQQMLMAASLKLQEQITNQSQNADKFGNAATTMDSAAKTADTAAKMFKTTVERNRTTFRVKRI